MLKNNLIIPFCIAIVAIVVSFSISLQKQTKKANELEVENIEYKVTVLEAKKAEKNAKDSLIIAKNWMVGNDKFNQKLVAEIQGTIREIHQKNKVLRDSVAFLSKGVIYKYKILKPKKGLFQKGYDTLLVN